MSGANITVMWRDEPRVKVCENKFPKAIVWGPLGCITCCIPVVGHMGIADSKGVIHDFAGPHTIGIDDFMVQCGASAGLDPGSFRPAACHFCRVRHSRFAYCAFALRFANCFLLAY